MKTLKAFSAGFALPKSSFPTANLPTFDGVEILTEAHTAEVFEFLGTRPVHTIVMRSLIHDNGLESAKNRGKFYGFRNSRTGGLEGVALIGHTTLVETSSTKALAAFARRARSSETPIKVMMSGGDSIERFWKLYAVAGQEPLHNFTEYFFELGFPFPVQQCEWDVRLAKPEEVEEVARAQAEVAFIESGICPLKKDREGFLKRCLRRIEQKRTFVAFADGKLVFKIDIAAETADIAYLEGFYVAPEMRGKEVGSKCLSKVGSMLLTRYETICGLSNMEFDGVHRSLAKAGFKRTNRCQTIFV